MMYARTHWGKLIFIILLAVLSFYAMILVVPHLGIQDRDLSYEVYMKDPKIVSFKGNTYIVFMLSTELPDIEESSRVSYFTSLHIAPLYNNRTIGRARKMIDIGLRSKPVFAIISTEENIIIVYSFEMRSQYNVLYTFRSFDAKSWTVPVETRLDNSMKNVVSMSLVANSGNNLFLFIMSVDELYAFKPLGEGFEFNTKTDTNYTYLYWFNDKENHPLAVVGYHVDSTGEIYNELNIYRYENGRFSSPINPKTNSFPIYGIRPIIVYSNNQSRYYLVSSDPEGSSILGIQYSEDLSDWTFPRPILQDLWIRGLSDTAFMEVEDILILIYTRGVSGSIYPFVWFRSMVFVRFSQDGFEWSEPVSLSAVINEEAFDSLYADQMKVQSYIIAGVVAIIVPAIYLLRARIRYALLRIKEISTSDRAKS